MAGAKRPVRLDWIKEGYNQVKSREKENKNESEEEKKGYTIGCTATSESEAAGVPGGPTHR